LALLRIEPLFLPPRGDDDIRSFPNKNFGHPLSKSACPASGNRDLSFKHTHDLPSFVQAKILNSITDCPPMLKRTADDCMQQLALGFGAANASPSWRVTAADLPE
jgi:hypothetical protein